MLDFELQFNYIFRLVMLIFCLMQFYELQTTRVFNSILYFVFGNAKVENLVRQLIEVQAKTNRIRTFFKRIIIDIFQNLPNRH